MSHTTECVPEKGAELSEKKTTFEERVEQRACMDKTDSVCFF